MVPAEKSLDSLARGLPPSYLSIPRERLNSPGTIENLLSPRPYVFYAGSIRRLGLRGIIYNNGLKIVSPETQRLPEC